MKLFYTLLTIIKERKVSTIGKEKKQNPRLQVSSVDEYVELMNNLNLKKPKKLILMLQKILI